MEEEARALGTSILEVSWMEEPLVVDAGGAIAELFVRELRLVVLDMIDARLLFV